MPPARRSPQAPLLGAAVTAVAGLILLYLLAVHTAEGQRLDDAARGGLGPEASGSAYRATSELLDTISVSSLAVFGLLIMGVAIARARPRLALGAGVLVLGSNVTTQILKRGLDRPDLGGSDFLGASFPSGHTTVAMSLAMALVLVAPPTLRWLAALAGGAYAVGVGVAVIALSWHRPSDALGAYLIVIAWTALVAAVLASPLGAGELGERRGHTSSARARALGAAGAAALTLIFAGVVAVAAARRIDLLQVAADRTAFVAAAVVCAAAGAALTVAMTGLVQRTRPVPARRR